MAGMFRPLNHRKSNLVRHYSYRRFMLVTPRVP